jgi:murein DD-endopeptidase MepM/ murein hydrolase activator NlpD
MKIKLSYVFSFLFVGILAFQLFVPIISHATLIDDYQKKIEESKATIANLEKEIAQYEAQVSLTSKQAATLKNLISTLDTTKKKLDTQIKLTQNKISATELTINKLGGEIQTQKSAIDQNNEALAETMRRMNQSDDGTLLESVLANSSVSVFLDDIQNLAEIQDSVKDHINTLQNLKQDLQNKQTDSEKSKNNLVGLKSDLSSQQKAVVYETQTKNKLLTDTKSQEANYQKILAEKKALKEAVDKELNDFEAQLQIAIDPNSVPKAKTGVLSWPLSSVRITQYFGYTDFAQAHPILYKSGGHPGIDLAASIGTKVKAALFGTIAGTGDTDKVCPAGSFGRWVLITHDNGLSTMYAHLSVINVSAGQKVATGDTIGLSGVTGYATGPHLHFSVFATQGVEITDWPSVSCKGGYYHTPVTPPEAKLNPRSYLPSLP